jgi:hypothetical protein
VPRVVGWLAHWRQVCAAARRSPCSNEAVKLCIDDAPGRGCQDLAAQAGKRATPPFRSVIEGPKICADLCRRRHTRVCARRRAGCGGGVQEDPVPDCPFWVRIELILAGWGAIATDRRRLLVYFQDHEEDDAGLVQGQDAVEAVEYNVLYFVYLREVNGIIAARLRGGTMCSGCGVRRLAGTIARHHPRIAGD